MNYEKEIKARLAIAESGDSRTTAYQQIADLIAEWMDKEQLTQVQVATRIGKSQATVRRLLNSRNDYYKTGQFSVNWENPPRVSNKPEKRADLAKELMSDPKIVRAVLASRSKAASNVRKAVSAENAEQRARSLKAAERKRQVEAMAIPSLFTRIADTIGDWSNALMDIEGDLVEARDQFGAGIVVTALQMHADTCTRLADRMQLDVGDYVKSR
jgi:hypothetical protein